MTDISEQERKFIPEAGPLAILWRHERALRLVLPLLALAVLGVLGLLPRIWTVGLTPEGRTQRISGLDWLQGRSLSQSARRLEAAGKHSDALAAWENAARQNPGDREFVLGMVRCLDRVPDLARLQLPFAADRLLHLSDTNRETLRWLAPVLARHAQWKWLGARLTGEAVGVEDDLGAIRSRAQFEEGEYAAFDAELAAFPGRLIADAELALISAGRRALQAKGAQEAEAPEKELELAATVPTTRPLALRLLLDLAFARRDLWNYERLLAAGGPEIATNLPLQVRYWRLVHGAGQRERAARLVRESGILPANGQDAAALLQVMAEFGLREPAELLGQQLLKQWGNSPSAWVAMGEALVTLEDWEGLRDHAVRLRQIVQFRKELGGHSWFLDGLAEHRLGHPERARVAWANHLEDLPVGTSLALRAAALFDRWDLPAEAFAVLVRLHQRGEPEDAVLVNLQRIAHQLRDLEWFARTSRALYERHPKDPRVLINFAASLMIQGDRSAEVLPLTLQVLQTLPDTGGATVNHAIALIQAGRPAEAAPLLERAETMSLGSSADGMLHFAKAGYFAALGQPDEARRQALKVRPEDLFPNQLQQLEGMLRPKVASRP